MRKPETKNPKDAIGVAKVSLSYVPEAALVQLALGMMEGRKYGRSNYRVAPVVATVYTDACMRHLLAFLSGRDHDPASRVHELGKAMATLACLVGAIAQGTWVDDRPPAMPDGWLEQANETAAYICGKFPAVAPYTEKEHGVKSRLGKGLKNGRRRKVPKAKKVQTKAARVRKIRSGRSKRALRDMLRAA